MTDDGNDWIFILGWTVPLNHLHTVRLEGHFLKSMCINMWIIHSHCPPRWLPCRWSASELLFCRRPLWPVGFAVLTLPPSASSDSLINRARVHRRSRILRGVSHSFTVNTAALWRHPVKYSLLIKTHKHAAIKRKPAVNVLHCVPGLPSGFSSFTVNVSGSR